MTKEHIFFYAIESLIIGTGFSVLLILNIPVFQQIMIFLSIMILYIVVGVFHHKIHNNLSAKVVLEYILISALLLTLFIFLNISKL